MSSATILVVDDEEAVREGLAELLAPLGYEVRVTGDGTQALKWLAEQDFDAVLLDVVMPEIGGLDVLGKYRSSGGAAPVIVLSGLSTADDAMRAMKLGATDYLAKPLGRDELEDALRRALPSEVSPRVEARPRSDDRVEPRQFVFASAAMHRTRALVDRIADADVPVLLLGESGTGKEVVARQIHESSRRRLRPFIKVNCAALPAELLESELFGHERGAFTGATAEKPGKFELADQGTIFLDEIGEMAIRLQAKLLQVLQDEEFFRVGGKKSVRVDSRVVVATNRELEREISLGNFREDLFYRLNVVAIRLPPLRERREDIRPLAQHFLRKHSRKARQPVPDLSNEVVQGFERYDWPGNVRELENMVRRIVVLNDASVVLDELRSNSRWNAAHPREPAYRSNEARSADGANVLVSEAANDEALSRIAAPVHANPFAVPQPPPPPPAKPESEMTLKDIGKRAAMLAEREAILAMLQRTAWNKRRAAGKLQISYKALLYKIKEAGIIDPRANAEF